MPASNSSPLLAQILFSVGMWRILVRTWMLVPSPSQASDQRSSADLPSRYRSYPAAGQCPRDFLGHPDGATPWLAWQTTRTLRSACRLCHDHDDASALSSYTYLTHRAPGPRFVEISRPSRRPLSTFSRRLSPASTA